MIAFVRAVLGLPSQAKQPCRAGVLKSKPSIIAPTWPLWHIHAPLVRLIDLPEISYRNQRPLGLNNAYNAEKRL